MTIFSNLFPINQEVAKTDGQNRKTKNENVFW